MVVAVFNSEFSGFTIVIGLMIRRNGSSEWKPLEESSNLWSFVVWINWKTKMIMHAVIEGSQLSGLAIIIDILLNLSISALVELIIFSWLGDESSIGAIIHFVSGIT